MTARPAGVLLDLGDTLLVETVFQGQRALKVGKDVLAERLDAVEAEAGRGANPLFDLVLPNKPAVGKSDAALLIPAGGRRGNRRSQELAPI